MAAARKGVGLALEQATSSTLCYVADIQPGASAALHGGALPPFFFLERPRIVSALQNF